MSGSSVTWSDEGPAAAGYLRAALGEAELGEFGELPMSQSREAYARWLEGQARRVRTDPTAELPFGYAEGARRLTYSVPGDSRPHRVKHPRRRCARRTACRRRNLCGHFDAWTFEDAVSFIVSGAIPPLAEVRASTRSSHLYPAASRVFLDIDPRTSLEEVSAWYGRLRQRHDVTRQQQPMSPRNLALAVFVECNWHPGVTWVQLLAAWNVAHPEGDDLHSEQSSRQFKVDCQRAWQGLTGALWPGGPNAAKRLRSQIARAHAKLTSGPARAADRRPTLPTSCRRGAQRPPKYDAGSACQSLTPRFIDRFIVQKGLSCDRAKYLHRERILSCLGRSRGSDNKRQYTDQFLASDHD